MHQLTGHCVEAISTTDIVSAPKQYFNDDRPVLLISFGRSGNSPESVAAVDIIEQRVHQRHHLILTCNPEGELASRAEDNQHMFAVLMPEATNDQSLAMTSSFSSMVVACLCIFSDKDLSEDIDRAAQQTEQLLEQQLSGLAALAEQDFDRLVYLGSGGLKAIARETSLKCMELTFGQIACLHDSPLGFRHGPKAIVNEKTLVVIFVSMDAETRRYEEDLIAELCKDHRAMEVIALNPELFCDDNPVSNDATLALPYLAYGQCLAFFKSLQMGLTVDNPCPTGEYNRVVEGVNLSTPHRAGITIMYYGLDIGGTKIEIARFNQELQQLDSARVVTPVDHYDDFISAIVDLVNEADQQSGEKGSVGIGIPGVLNPDTGLLLTSNVPCASQKPVQDDLKKALNRTIAIENEAPRCFAYSEANGGAANGYERVFGAIIGTGAGGGFCIDGDIYHGAHRVCGEWGHLPVSAKIRDRYDLSLRSCGCGLCGCYEHYMAGPGIAKLHTHFGGDDIATPDIINRYCQQDPVAVKTFDAFIDIAAAALANLVMTIDPDAIVMGGGLSKVPELYQLLPNAVSKHLFSTLSAPRILAPMYGDSGGVRGAAILGSRQ